jgi:hypothetical protein
MTLPHGTPGRLNWRKPTFSIANGDCAEVASAAGIVVVRDTKDPSGTILNYSSGSWLSFVTDIRRGSYDALD